MINIVIDTNVMIAALRSKRGASFKLVSLIGTGVSTINLSVPLFLEYETVMKRAIHEPFFNVQDINDILAYIAAVANKRDIFFLWRPFLKDPKDDMMLEVAVESNSEFIISHNVRDFIGVDKFGITVISPNEFLKIIGASS
jgi:putative PIN family toxin of toxin-antitoxin system